MSRDDLHFRLRIPEKLKLQVEEAAAKKRRSMTAEIIDRLEETFRQDEWLPEGSGYNDMINKAVSKIKKETATATTINDRIKSINDGIETILEIIREKYKIDKY